jgi:hypothetical protein
LTLPENGIVCLSHVRLILLDNEYSMKTGVPRHLKGVIFPPVRSVLLGACRLLVLLSGLSGKVQAKAPAAAPLQTAVVEGREGWLFLGAELRFLAAEKFWETGPQKKATTAPPPPAGGGVLPAIVDFDRQLKAAGVRLLLVPVPPKAWGSRYAPAGEWAGVNADSLGGFYRELSAQGVEVLDLRPAFAAREASGEAMFCKTDSHWSGRGCAVAAQLVAERLRVLLPPASASFQAQWKEFSIKGDLEQLAQSKAGGGEALLLRQVADAGGKALSSDTASPLLLIGDSHTLVFRDFQGERAGLADQLAMETGTVPEVIGTRGSGANAVRLSLFRRNVKDPRYIASKKVVVWCFAAREFTEAEQGWQLIPLSRAEVKKK